MLKINMAALAASSFAIAVASIATPAFAQSTGSVDFENQIVVTGAKQKPVGGIELPDTPKAKEVLDQTLISRASPGQTVNDIINMVPGVAFFNADPFGSSGGKLFIRGFDNSRISETFDGIPLNDTGNYSIYSNQMLDPELIDEVNVNLGTTDIDSPTASATGSTVNYRSRMPAKDFHARVVGSAGEYGFMRIFGVVDTGVLTKSGTRAWFSASSETNNMFTGHLGGIDKKQFNAKIYQPIGDNGDFISIAGHWNRNRNNYFPSVLLWNENFGSRSVNSTSSGRYPTSMSEEFYDLSSCYKSSSGCSGQYESRYNPSDTGNIRINSRFTLNDRMVLTVDPYFTYTKANGGSIITGNDSACYYNSSTHSCSTTASAGTTAIYGLIGGSYYFGKDLNGDGIVNTTSLYAPSNTITNRLGVIVSLRYEFNKDQIIRVGYTWDRGRHRQTGEVGYLNSAGFAVNPFPIDNPITDVNGNVVEKRNRLSYAILHQISGEYSGRFLDGKLNVIAGVRAPFMKRNLNQNCFTTSAGGSLACFEDATSAAVFAAANPTVSGPQHRDVNYNRVLPTAGFTFRFTPNASMFFNYSKGLQVPGTDNLYNSFYYAVGTNTSLAVPETSNNFDLGLRWRSRRITAQLSGWYTQFNNRLASAYDRDLQQTIYTNLGRVDRYGIDGSVSYVPSEALSVYAFGSWLHSKIKGNVAAGSCSQSQVTMGILGCTVVNGVAYFQTAGKFESAVPEYMLGARVEGHLGALDMGVQFKRTGPRYVNDQNLPFYVTVNGALTEAFKAKAPAYNTVDLTARLNLDKFGAHKDTFLQLNVTNLFNQYYVGGFDSTTVSYQASTPPTYANLGMPRTIMGSISVAF